MARLDNGLTELELEYTILKTQAKYANEIIDSNPEKAKELIDSIWCVLLGIEKAESRNRPAIEKPALEIKGEKHLKLIK